MTQRTSRLRRGAEFVRERSGRVRERLRPRNLHAPSLDWLNFLIADVRGGLGPYIIVYLITEQGWSPTTTGLISTTSGWLGLAAQAPRLPGSGSEANLVAAVERGEIKVGTAAWAQSSRPRLVRCAFLSSVRCSAGARCCDGCAELGKGAREPAAGAMAEFFAARRSAAAPAPRSHRAPDGRDRSPA